MTHFGINGEVKAIKDLHGDKSCKSFGHTNTTLSGVKMRIEEETVNFLED
jgi:hypothetical protein